jgi:hypothetical protein
LHKRRKNYLASLRCEEAQWVDPRGMAIEEFGNVDNPMLEACPAEQGHPIVRWQSRSEQRFTDLGGFLACLDHAERQFRRPRSPKL